MKKTALLIDGGWFSRGLGKILKLPGKWPSASQVVGNAVSILKADEELFRIFYYDCEPFGHVITNPIDGSKIDYGKKRVFTARKQFFSELGQTDGVALRRGELKTRGWEFCGSYKKSLESGSAPGAPGPQDVYPNFEQKGVDMRIGIDVATLSLRKIIDRIILFSADTDMIPAIKLARREGLQIFVVKLEPWPLTKEIIEDSDGVRHLIPTPCPYPS